MERFGWPVLDISTGADTIRVTSRVRETPIRLDGVGRALITGSGSGLQERLTLLRIEVGEPTGPPTRWALVRRKEASAQLAGGQGWAIVASSLVITDLSLPSDQQKLLNLFELVKRLIRNDRAAGAPLDLDWPFVGLDQPLIGHGSRTLKVGGGTLMAAAFVGAAGMLAIGDLALLFLYPFGCAGLGGLLMYASGHVRRKQLFRAHRQALSVDQALASSHVFEGRGMITASTPRWFTVVGRQGEERRLAEAVLQTALLEARSKVHGLVLRLRLHAITWPTSTMEGCMLLPSSWATVAVFGPEAALARVPFRHHEERFGGSIRWQMGADELEQGALSNWISQVDGAFHGDAAGPYR